MTGYADSPEAVLALLAPYASTFHECWRLAVDDARAHFEKVPDERLAREPWLFAHHARWSFKRHLADHLPPGTPIVLDYKTIMSSAIVRLGDLVVRFRKSDPGDVPPPGSSTTMQRWYAQTLDGSVETHVLALWHVDKALRYTGLDIALPCGGSAYAPLVEWVAPLGEGVGVADDLAITLRPSGREADAAGGTVGRP